MPNLHLIFSHKLTESQIESAQQDLKVSNFFYMPDEILNVWNSIPADEVSVSSHITPVLNYLEKCVLPNDFVLIQGDFGAVYLTVQKVFELKATPIYSTTRRVHSEKNDNGKVVMQKVFSHVMYRKYENLKI